MEPFKKCDNNVFIEERRTASEPKDPRVRSCYKTDWWQEIGSSILSVLCILGMVILLSRIQNQQLALWSLPVSPNAFISVLSTASKAFLILPVSECISQLKWVYLLESRKEDRYATSPRPAESNHQELTVSSRLTNLQNYDNASRGPLGSFRFFFYVPTKSWLPYVGCAITLAAIATDAFAQQILAFETQLVELSGVYSELRASQDVYMWDYDALYRMQKSVRLSLYDEPQLPDLHCPGSVCTYPSFASIGVSSQCQDVTAGSKSNCTIRTSQPTQSQYETCNITTPGGFQLQGLQVHKDNRAPLGMTGSSSSTKETVSPGLVGVDVLLEFGILQYPDESGDFKTHMQVHECTMRMCAVEYTGWSSTSETVHPGLLKTYSMTNSTPLEDMGQGDELMKLTVSDPAFLYPTKSYGLNIENVGSLQSILDDNLIPTERGAFGSVASALFGSPGGVPAALANVAAAITHRMLDGPNSTVTRVPVSDYEVVIVVRWAWIALPAALVLAAGLLLLAVVDRTRRAEQLVWKSSLTPLLLAPESYPVARAGQKPHWTPTYLKTRTAAIVNHLTK